MARRGRPKKVKEPEQTTDTQPEPVQEAVESIKAEPEPQQFFSMDEAATHFRLSEHEIKRWVEHGILTGPRDEFGRIRITRASMLRCKFQKRAIGPLM